MQQGSGRVGIGTTSPSELLHVHNEPIGIIACVRFWSPYNKIGIHQSAWFRTAGRYFGPRRRGRGHVGLFWAQGRRRGWQHSRCLGSDHRSRLLPEDEQRHQSCYKGEHRQRRYRHHHSLGQAFDQRKWHRIRPRVRRCQLRQHSPLRHPRQRQRRHRHHEPRPTVLGCRQWLLNRRSRRRSRQRDSGYAASPAAV